MSDVMLIGVLRMPLPEDPSEISPLEWEQIKSRMRQAADRIESLPDHIDIYRTIKRSKARKHGDIAKAVAASLTS